MKSFIKHMKINRTLTIKELIDKLGYKQYLNEEVVKTLKNTGPKIGEIEFFKLNKTTTVSEVEKEYQTRNLVPDLGAVLACLIENPKMLDEKNWIGVQMEDNCFATFDRWDGERRVNVLRYDDRWDGNYWFAGRRKSSEFEPSPSSETLSLDLPDELIINNVKYRKV